MTDTITDYRARVMGCWLGKAAGGTLGMPFEGQDGPLDVWFYSPVPTEMLPNDDLDLQVLWACVLDKQDPVRVDRHVLARAWRENCRFPWDEYGVARRNLAEGIAPPLSGSFDNWFARGMGAAIRSEVWACLAPGDPTLAALYAYEDACVDHAGEGIWAEVFFAALESAAFASSDPDDLLDGAEAALPPESEVRRAAHDTRLWWRASRDWRIVRAKVLEGYGHENFTDVVMNVAFTVLGWLAGEGDFGRAVCIANNCGKDTDCTAATVGALMGIIDPAGIPDEWLAPIGRDLVVSPEIIGIEAPVTLDGFSDLVVRLRERLGGHAPDTANDAQEMPPGIIAEAGFLDALPDAGAPAPAFPPGHGPLTLPGTVGAMPAADFKGEALLLRYSFHLDRPRTARVLFNTREACRVWVDGTYAFGREGGLMAPSLHRVPAGQATNLFLEAGEHILLAALGCPAKDRISDAEWVVAVGDVQTNQWLPGVFR